MIFHDYYMLICKFSLVEFHDIDKSELRMQDIRGKPRILREGYMIVTFAETYASLLASSARES